MDIHMRDRVKRCIVQILTFILLCVPGPLYASNYEWVQSDWSGGADTSAVAIHPDDQTEWNRFYSKDPYVRTSIPGEASIFPQPASIIQTADLNDFDRGTLTNTLRLVGSGGYVFTTYQETDLSAVVRTGQWFSTTLHNPSGGRYIFSIETGATVTLSFTGTQATWIGPKYHEFGIADVYLDGDFQGSVDLYSASLQSQQPLFTASDLSNTTHTLMIVVTGRKNSSAVNYAVGVDAFDVVTAYPDVGAYLRRDSGYTAGDYESPSFDAGTGGALLLSLTWNATVPAGSSLRFQIATKNIDVPGSWPDSDF